MTSRIAALITHNFPIVVERTGSNGITQELIKTEGEPEVSHEEKTVELDDWFSAGAVITIREQKKEEPKPVEEEKKE